MPSQSMSLQLRDSGSDLIYYIFFPPEEPVEIETLERHLIYYILFPYLPHNLQK